MVLARKLNFNLNRLGEKWEMHIPCKAAHTNTRRLLNSWGEVPYRRERYVNLSEVTLWALSVGPTLECGARLNAPRRQLPRSVSQRDDVHWKHIGFPVALHLSPVYGHSYPRWHGSVVTFVCVEHRNSNMTKPSVASRSRRVSSHLAMGNLVGSVKICGEDHR